jgi:hypothetical protein
MPTVPPVPGPSKDLPWLVESTVMGETVLSPRIRSISSCL